MPVGVRFDTGKSFVKLEGNTSEFITNIPEVEAEMANGIAQELKEAIIQSIEAKDLDFTGNLLENVEVTASENGEGTSFSVTANAYSDDGVNYAAWHEYSETSHTAYYYDADGSPNQELIKWAMAKGIFKNTWKLEVTPLNVREGGFMEPAVQETISNTRRNVRSGNNDLNTALAEAYR